LAGNNDAHDLHKGDLDGVGVFEDGEIGGSAGAVGIERNAGLPPLLVKETELIAFQGWRAALGAVDLDVLTTGTFVKRPPAS
jgi:hypothetical protein